MELSTRGECIEPSEKKRGRQILGLLSALETEPKLIELVPNKNRYSQTHTKSDK